MEYKRLSIPNPCSENWEQMKNDNAGRHCDSCKTVVVDFSEMSDKELIRVLQMNKFHCCRVSQDQLDRLYTLKPQRSDRSKYWMTIAASLVAGLLQVSTSYSQSPVRPKILRPMETQFKGKAEIQTRKITIEVVMGNKNKPVEYARIYFNEGNYHFLLTDSLGIASFDIPEELLSLEQFNLTITKSIGIGNTRFEKKYAEEFMIIPTQITDDKIRIKLLHFKKQRRYRFMGCPSF